MSKVLVKWNKTHVMSVGTGLNDASIVKFIPGANEFTQEQWDKVKNNPELKKRMETQIVDPKRGKVPMLEVISEGKKAETTNGDEGDNGSNDDNGPAISELGVKEAKELVKETFNTPLLREWYEGETRKGVKEAIEKQLQTIEDERKNNDDDENGSQE